MINLVDIKETLRQFIPNNKLRTEIRKRNVIIYISNSLSMGQILNLNFVCFVYICIVKYRSSSYTVWFTGLLCSIAKASPLSPTQVQWSIW